MDKHRKYEAFKKTLANMTPEEYEKAVRDYCRKNRI